MIDHRRLPTSGRTELILQTAPLTNAVALSRPFVDRNKRDAWTPWVTFLALNGHSLPDSALELLAQQLITQHEVSDRSRADQLLADWLSVRLKP